MAKLDDKILFRLNKGLKEVLKRRCKKMGKSVGDYIRKLILDDIKNKSISKKEIL